MRRSVLCAAILLAAACAERREPGFAFTELAYPGSELTTAAGINAAGHIVGWYRQGDRTTGFVYRDGRYESVQYPGSILTQLYGINAEGDLVGAYRNDGEPAVAFHGFLRRRSGEVVEIRHPDHKHTIAQRLLADGTILGCYHDDDFGDSMHAVVIPPAAVSEAEVDPAAIHVLDRSASMHNGATPDGARVVGFVMDTREAYTIDRGTLTTFGAPGATRTEAWDINASGTIVGMFVDAQSASHGYVLEDGRYTIVDYPGASSTVAFGINARGDVVGGYTGADGQRRGYLASRR